METLQTIALIWVAFRLIKGLKANIQIIKPVSEGYESFYQHRLNHLKKHHNKLKNEDFMSDNIINIMLFSMHALIVIMDLNAIIVLSILLLQTQ